MYEEKTIIITEFESQINKLRIDLESTAERHSIWTPANASISEPLKGQGATLEFHNSPASDKYCDITGPAAGDSPLDDGPDIPTDMLPMQIMGCPPEISTLSFQYADLFGRVNEILDRQTQAENRQTAAEEKLAKDRQDLLEQQIAVANSHVWAVETKISSPELLPMARSQSRKKRSATIRTTKGMLTNGTKDTTGILGTEITC